MTSPLGFFIGVAGLYLAFVAVAEPPSWVHPPVIVFFFHWLVACLAAEAKNSNETWGALGRFLQKPYKTLMDLFNTGLPRLLLPELVEDGRFDIDNLPSRFAYAVYSFNIHFNAR